MLFIKTGRVEISAIAADGRESTLNQLETGGVIGEILMLDRSLRSAVAIAANEVTGIVVNCKETSRHLTRGR